MRLSSWVKRYVNNQKAKAFNEPNFKKRQFLLADEIKESEQLWIKENRFWQITTDFSNQT